jgi:hypothetical protein
MKVSTHFHLVTQLRISGVTPSFPIRLHGVQWEKITFPDPAAAYVVLGACRQITTRMLFLTLKHADTTLLLICAVESLN